MYITLKTINSQGVFEKNQKTLNINLGCYNWAIDKLEINTVTVSREIIEELWPADGANQT